MTAYDEKCSFLDLPGQDQYLYVITYIPSRPTGPGVVIAPPIGRERLRCYRESANLARDLANQGYPVIRFDYRGEGESGGAFQQADLTSRVEDLAAAAHELARLSGQDRVCLLGLRLGAVIAVMAAAELNPEHLLLVDPLCNPRGQVRALLRSNVVLQTSYHGRVSRDAAALRQAVDRGEPVSVYGFMLGAPLLRELETVAIKPLLSDFSGRADIIAMGPREAPPKRDVAGWLDLLGKGGAQARHRCAVLPFSWNSRRRWVPSLGPLNEAVLACLEETT